VALAEKKIGEELLKERQPGGRLRTAGRPWPEEDKSRDANFYPKATIAELGLTKQQNRDFVDMATVPVEIIHQTVEAANAAGQVVTKAEIKVDMPTLIRAVRFDFSCQHEKLPWVAHAGARRHLFRTAP
jgi:hypothetical protein